MFITSPINYTKILNLVELELCKSEIFCSNQIESDQKYLIQTSLKLKPYMLYRPLRFPSNKQRLTP